MTITKLRTTYCLKIIGIVQLAGYDPNTKTMWAYLASGQMWEKGRRYREILGSNPRWLIFLEAVDR